MVAVVSNYAAISQDKTDMIQAVITGIEISERDSFEFSQNDFMVLRYIFS